MQFRFLLNLIIFFLLADNIINAQEFRSFEISGYPELNEIMPDRSPVSSPAPIVGKIKLHTGVTLEYSESGNPNGRPVIFLHPSLVWKAVLSGLTEVDYSTSLKNINAPVLIIYGDKDNFSSTNDQEKFRSSLHGPRLLVYRGVGHAIHWEDPGQTAIDVSAFVKDIDKK